MLKVSFEHVYHDDLHTVHRSKYKRNLWNLFKIKEKGPNKK